MKKYNVTVYATVLKDLPVLLEDVKNASQEVLTQILVNTEVMKEILPSVQYDVIIETLDAEVEVTRKERDETLSKVLDKFFSKGGKLS